MKDRLYCRPWLSTILEFEVRLISILDSLEMFDCFLRRCRLWEENDGGHFKQLLWSEVERICSEYHLFNWLRDSKNRRSVEPPCRANRPIIQNIWYRLPTTFTLNSLNSQWFRKFLVSFIFEESMIDWWFSTIDEETIFKEEVRW